jgi:alkanesulfonate monooxygenase SsuD/methylene tetrahydromethanopterin reductase-like flavin-dependent oxidoreductase (luciferase family)
MQKPYLFIPLDMTPPQIIKFAQEVEERGFAGLMMSTRFGDNIALSLAILNHTKTIRVATGITDIYTRHPSDMASAASLIEALHPGRFILGIGVAHAPTHDSLGVTVGKPLGDTRNYVKALHEASSDKPFPKLMLAALRKRMTALAGEISEGVIWANAAQSHLKESLEQIADRPRGFVVGNITRTLVTDDVRAGRNAFRESFLMYMELPNYQNYYIEAGFQDEISAARAALARGDTEATVNAITDRMADDLCNVGTAEQIRAKVQSWYDLGVTDLALSPMSLSNPAMAHKELMAVFD